LKLKHPEITLEYIKKGKGSMLTDLVSAGHTPDLILVYHS
jgi:hypothetical protein